MNKNLIILSLSLILVFASCVNAQTACSSLTNTLLKSQNNPNGPEALATPQTVTGLTYCKSLEGKQSCCSRDVINNLVNSARNEINDINNKSKVLDQAAIDFMKAAQGIVLEQSNYTAEMKKFNESTATSTRMLLQMFERVLQNQNQNLAKAFGLNLQEAKDRSKSLLQNLTGLVQSNQGKSNQSALNLGKVPRAQAAVQNIQKKLGGVDEKKLKDLMKEAQQGRTQCLRYLAKLKTQFSCLACDYTLVNDAITKGRLDLSSQICSDIQLNCYQFATLNQNVSLLRNSRQMQQQYQAIQQQRQALNQINSHINNFVSQLQSSTADAANQTQSLIQTAIQKLNTTQVADNSVNTTFEVRQLPATCTSNRTCEYLCTQFINLQRGGVDFDKAQNPGELSLVNITDSTQVSSLDVKKMRVLQLSSSVSFTSSGSSLPDSGLQAVVDEQVQSDPAGVSNANVAASLDNVSSDSSTTTKSTFAGNLISYLFMSFVLFMSLLI